MITTWVVSFSLILARVGTFVTVLPLFGTNSVPRMVRVGLAVALTLFWFDFSKAPGDEFLSRAESVPWLAFGVALAREAILGALLGYMLGLLLAPARIAGEFIGQEMGLAFGNLIDPTSAQPSGPVTQIFEMIGILVFFGLDGHQLFLIALHATFGRWPLGGSLTALPVAQLVTGAATAEEWGILLAAPLAFCLFLTTAVLALMARAAPGLVACIILLPDILRGMAHIFGRMGEFLVRSI